MLNPENRVGVIYYLISFLFSLSLLSLVAFSVMRWPSLSSVSHCRLTSLIILHLFFMIMIYRLKLIADMTVPKLLEWIVVVNGGIFLVTNIAQAIIYLRNPRFVDSILLFEIALDPVERILIGFWNYMFLSMWIYNSSCYITLLLILTIYKKYQREYMEERARELAERIKEITYVSGMAESHCSICLMEYE